MSKRWNRARKPRRIQPALRDGAEVGSVSTGQGIHTSRQRDAFLHALLQNGWIVVGVFALGWSASVTVGGIYLETLFCSLALQRAVRQAGRASHRTGSSIDEAGVTRPETFGDRTRTTTMIGLAQGAFVLAFGAAVLLGPEGVDAIWRMSLPDLGTAALGALITGVVEHRRLRRRIPTASEAWLHSRLDLQFTTTLTLVMFMLVVPWSFFLVGERGLFVVLIGGKTLLDTWLAGRPPALV